MSGFRSSWQRLYSVLHILLLFPSLSFASNKFGTKFLQKNKAAPGVVTLPSGLQYKIITAGTGTQHPAEDSPCDVHYEGRTAEHYPSGEVFDSSYARGKPETVSTSSDTAGWTEALPFMVTGDKWLVYLPSELAYGNEGMGNKIPGGSVLVFTVELVNIKGSSVPAKDRARSSGQQHEDHRAPSTGQQHENHRAPSTGQQHEEEKIVEQMEDETEKRTEQIDEAVAQEKKIEQEKAPKQEARKKAVVGEQDMETGEKEDMEPPKEEAHKKKAMSQEELNPRERQEIERKKEEMKELKEEQAQELAYEKNKREEEAKELSELTYEKDKREEEQERERKYLMKLQAEQKARNEEIKKKAAEKARQEHLQAPPIWGCNLNKCAACVPEPQRKDEETCSDCRPGFILSGTNCKVDYSKTASGPKLVAPELTVQQTHIHHLLFAFCGIVLILGLLVWAISYLMEGDEDDDDNDKSWKAKNAGRKEETAVAIGASACSEGSALRGRAKNGNMHSFDVTEEC